MGLRKKREKPQAFTLRVHFINEMSHTHHRQAWSHFEHPDSHRKGAGKKAQDPFDSRARD